MSSLQKKLVFMMVLGLLGGIWHLLQPTVFCWPPDPDEVAGRARILRTLQALRDGQFEQLEQPAAAEPVFDFSVFGSVDPALEKHFDAWIHHSPSAAIAYVARGEHLLSRAWMARGHDYAYQVQDSRFERMRPLVERARADAEQALRLDPKMLHAHSLRIRVALLGGGDRAAIAEAALEYGSASPEIWMDVAHGLQPRWHGEPGDLEKLRREAWWSDLNREDRHVVETHIDCLLLSERHRDYKFSPESLAELDQVIGTGPASQYCLGLRADVLRVLHRPRDAWADLNRMLAYDPADSGTAVTRSYFYSDRKYADEVRKSMQLALEMSPGDPAPLRQLADLEFDDGRYDAALAVVRRELEIVPEAMLARVRLADLLLRDQRHHDEARGILVQLKSESAALEAAELWVRLKTFELLGEHERVLELTSECDLSRADDAWCIVFQLRAQVATGQHETAGSELKIQLQLYPKWKQGLELRADLELARGEKAAALASLASASRLPPNDPKTWLRYAQVAREQQDCAAQEASRQFIAACGQSDLCFSDLIDERVREPQAWEEACF